jgi:hypothetical protein
MGKRKRISDSDSNSDWRARWQEGHDEMVRLLEQRKARTRELEELDARRRARLRRLTFGLLGR